MMTEIAPAIRAAFLGGCLCAVAPAALACDWDRPLAEHLLDAFVWEAIADGAGYEIDELLEAAGQITVAPAVRGQNPDGLLCAKLETSLTCSMGISVCAHLVIGPAPARHVLLDAAEHDLIAQPDPRAGRPLIFLGRTDRWGTIQETRYVMQADGTYDVVN